MQADGLAKRLEHAHAKTAVIGISGGLDSCLALLVAVRAMKQLGRPATDVLAVTMPCFGTTQPHPQQRRDSVRASWASRSRRSDIANTVRSHFADIGQDENVLDVTFENGQARVRTLELMDLANRTGGLVVGTGDLSELALGWATYNGDHMSMYGVNAGVPKTLVRHLVQYEADIAATEALHDRAAGHSGHARSPRSCCPPRTTARSRRRRRIWWAPTSCTISTSTMCSASALARPRSTGWQRPPLQAVPSTRTAVLYKWLRNFYWRFFAQQFKRSCLPDGPKVGSVTLSPRGDWRMPSDAAAALWLAELEQIPLNNNIG